MAYNAKQLVRQGGAGFASGNVKSNWMYASADSLATILASGYFNSATRRLNQGDIIDVVAGVGATLEFATIMVTSAKGAATVTTQNKSSVQSVTSGIKIARGQHTTVAESDTVVTGLSTVVAVVVQLDSDPVDGAMHVTGSIGDQAGTPAAGSILIKSWKSTDGDATLVAGSTFTKKVNWIAIGV
jgi:hypothetical protein